MPERVMKLAGRMDCQGLLVQAILSLLLSRGRAQWSNDLLVKYNKPRHLRVRVRGGGDIFSALHSEG